MQFVVTRPYLALAKPLLSLSTAFTAAVGFLMCRQEWHGGCLTLFSGTLFLAGAASALNEIQEAKFDALMERTRQRPLPGGTLGRAQAALFALGLFLGGLGVLYFCHGLLPCLWGLAAVLCYNGLYTPLKRHSAFAAVPGALVGAIPPLLGWSAAGGHWAHPAILSLVFVIFLWQIPHFWLLALLHDDCYRRAGFPTLSTHFQEGQIRRLIFTWTCAALAACGWLVAWGAVAGLPAMLLLGLACLWLFYKSLALLQGPWTREQVKSAFIRINLFEVAVMASALFTSLSRR